MKKSLRPFFSVGLLVLLLLYLGYTIGSLFPGGEFVYAPTNPLLTQNVETLAQLRDAVVGIANCEPFQHDWPKQHKKFMKLTNGSFYIAYNPAPPEKDIIAYAPPTGTTVYVAPLFFTYTDRQRQIVLAHELLHLAGLPSHHEPLDRSKDAVYKLTARCYPFDNTDF